MPAPKFIDLVTGLFEREGVSASRARRVAELYAQASADGVHSHGANRVPHVLAWLRGGQISNHDRDPERVAAFGALERYDGHGSFGALNAEFCMDRAMALADDHGLGCVALRNTGHWGRPGNYGWRAVERGYLGICWSNTEPMMPAWGGTTKSIGNNPIVFAAPGENGAHLVLDIAMSQYSWGRLDSHRASGEPLPVPGGLDAEGQVTSDPDEILQRGTMFPMGFWKGSGLAIVLDAFAAILADGANSAKLTDGLGLSQVFIAMKPNALGGAGAAARTREVIEGLATANPEARYPGQAVLAARRESAQAGLFVRDDVWAQLTAE
ncbi:3-dehydro-L-gulonate 2-dehydrogenase [Synoicihabitans lomoniglobus]|uniref:3-dehydro-L-gulonate 2-dehydrogenase n=1 Tax=Synoicihabitans lomoniglobus TaxID=2909285 RepID=A0AAF0CPH9_9BACT|nr:3-dehydro-L-gulonate 2-dehydrogenase [Opitutaceae bacterium LMO-M01]WED64834.1 3-dehydro-L-gulonate 2-dehydrogenase [Opitutaceae bacterium LMO-M01]